MLRFILILGIFISFLQVNAQTFIDTLDNHIDFSEILRTKYGFVAVPTIITEPAIGYGVGGGLVFIHRDPVKIKSGENSPPSFSGIGGFYTESKSWAVGGGHFGVWKDGDIRYRGGLGYASMNLNYYRTPVLPGEKDVLKLNITAYGIMQEIVFRIRKSDFYAGASYAFSKSTVKFDHSYQPPEIARNEMELNIGGLGMVLHYDSRDNIFTPDQGMYAGIHYVYNAPLVGSDKTFQRLFIHWLGYTKLLKDLYGGLRLDYQSSFEDTPFYLRPYIS